jgi:hypothetical protein
MADDAVKLTLPPGTWPRIRKLAGQAGEPIDTFLVGLITDGVARADLRPAPAAPQPVKRPDRLIDVPARSIR